MPNYVPGSGSFLAKLMIVGESPGKAENFEQKPFVGPSGQILDEILKALGMSRSEIYITNVVKYQPPLNRFDDLASIGVNLEESIQSLWRDEIDKIRPNCILAVGDRALSALTGLSGIYNYRGSILRAKDGSTKVVPTIHLANLFPRPPEPALPWVWKVIITHDIQRAIEESRSSEFSLPHRDLFVARSSSDVSNFFREYRQLHKASNDIESINCIPVCTGFAFNSYHALSIPLIKKVGGNTLTDMSQRELAECWKLVAEQFERLEIVGSNYKYDEYKQSLLGFYPIKCISDTQMKAHTIFPELPEKGLAMCSSLWTREPFYKEQGKEPKFGKFNVDQFFLYNARDCAVEWEVDESMDGDLDRIGARFNIPLRSFYYDYVMKKHSFYLKMENNGFRVDHNQKENLKGAYEYLREVAQDSLDLNIGYHVNVKSYPDIYKLLYTSMKFRAPKKEPTSEDALVALMNTQCKGKSQPYQRQILENILEVRRIRDQISRAIDFIPDYDGRCKTSVKITGTETARTSTGILNKPVRPKKIGLAFHTIPKHGRLAKDIRSMFIPDEGFVFIQGDLSQAEARIVAVLSEDWELLEAFDRIDIHRRTAALFFGLTRSLILTDGFIKGVDDLEKDGVERHTGKTFRHAGNYDMGKKTAMINYNTNAQKYGMDTIISEFKSGLNIELFHKASPNIRGVFHRDIRAALDNNRWLINPYGRPREFCGKYEDDLYKEGFAQIPQSTVADTTQSAALSAWDDWGHDSRIAIFLAENHDALIAQVPIGEWRVYAESLKRHMVRPIDFSTCCTLRRDCILRIPVDIEVSIDPITGAVTNYGSLYKMSKVVA